MAFTVDSPRRARPTAVDPAVFGAVRDTADDTLRLAGLLLSMPLRVVGRFFDGQCELISVAGSARLDLRPGLQFPLGGVARETLYSGVIEDEESAVFSLPPFAERGLRAYAGVPITLGDGQVAGFLAAADTRRRELPPATLDAFAVLGRLLAHDVERAERERELRTLAEVSQAFVRSTDLEAAQGAIIRQAVAMFEADYCLLHRVDPHTGGIYLAASHGLPRQEDPPGGPLAENPRSATARAIRSRQVLLVPDARRSDLPDPATVARYDLASILYLPLLVGDEVEGVLTIAHRTKPYEFSASQLRIAAIVADEAALTMRRHELLQSMREHQRELTTINNLSRVAASSLELKPLLRRLADELSRAVDATTSFIVLRDEEGALRPAAASAPHHDAYRRFAVLPQDPSISAAVIARRAPVVIPDVAASEFRDSRILTHFPIRAVVGVPLIARDKVLGVALVGDSRGPRQFTPDEVRLLQTAATQISLAIANAQLFEEATTLAVHDPLTGAFNRRQLERVLREEIGRSRRYGRALSCLMIDLDHFKSVNDRYGHALGDDVLRELVGRLRRAARTSDIVARFGGEEFVVVLPETRLQEAALTAERLRSAIADRPFDLPLPLQQNQRVQLSVTISLGLAELSPAVEDGQDLLERADSALYKAKAAGRNRLAVYE